MSVSQMKKSIAERELILRAELNQLRMFPLLNASYYSLGIPAIPKESLAFPRNSRYSLGIPSIPQELLLGVPVFP